MIQLKKSHRILKLLYFPATRQATDYTCAENVVQKVCEYYGDDYREMDLAKWMKADPNYGTDVENIIRFFETRTDLKIAVKENMTIPNLWNYLNRDIPVILQIQAFADDPQKYSRLWADGHFTVAVGFSRTAILFSDPAIYDIGYIKNKDLLERWHDKDGGIDGKRYHRLGIAVYGKEPKFNLRRIEAIP